MTLTTTLSCLFQMEMRKVDKDMFSDQDQEDLITDWLWVVWKVEDGKVTPIFLPESTRRIQFYRNRKTGGYTDLEGKIKSAVWQVQVKMLVRHQSEDLPQAVAHVELQPRRAVWARDTHLGTGGLLEIMVVL